MNQLRKGYVSCSSCSYSAQGSQVFLINFYNRGIILIWHINILSGPREVGRGIFSNVHIVVENDQIGHGMQINSLYLCLVIWSKNPCSTYLLFRWGNCRWLVPEYTAYGWQGWDKKFPCLNSFDILCYSARNSENINNLWEFLGAVCYFHYSPSQDSYQLPKHRESESGLLWHQICGVSRKKSNTPNTH